MSVIAPDDNKVFGITFRTPPSDRYHPIALVITAIDQFSSALVCLMCWSTVCCAGAASSL